MANPTLTPFPTPPQPEQDEVTFNRNAANSLLAQANFVTEGNIVITWMGQQIDAVSTNTAAAVKSAKDAASGATAASGSAESAANSASQAQTYAAAAGAAAGAPSISGKSDYMYSVNAAGNGTEWRVAPKRPTVATAGQCVIVNQAGNGFDTKNIPVPVITKYFESNPITINNLSSLSVSHGLGIRPKFIMAHLLCQQAEQGYSVGDMVEVPFFISARPDGNAGGQGVGMTSDASSINIFFSSSPFHLGYKNSQYGNFQPITTSYWKLILRAGA